ncbi:MAG TPA: DNA ligase D [Thermoanaerobaculia bacterium]|jgi:bifunctional non-homologous end joining protein LigD|nr:DNA ligase D [Thermoanaerobaculia bacterium]
MPHDRLAKYRAKRSPGVTPEPFGEGAEARPRLFCVQLHAARRRHYDLRLEMEGVLRSWAVPNGFSADPATKRLAVQTEDHPVEYADFEGLIPKGEYGGGSMIVWDRGLWVPLLPPEESMPNGKLLFELRGFKLRGKWTLVKTGGSRGKQNPDEWLLIKERGDGWVRKGEEAEAFAPESVLSGLTVEELRDGVDRAAEVIDELPALKAPKRTVDPRRVELMLARQRDRAFRREGWLFELKYDGYRTLAARTANGPLLLSRAGHDLTQRFPEVARAVAALPGDGLVVDGELVVLDDGGRPTFQGLQKRAQLTRRLDVEQGAVERPASLYLFDLLAIGGHDLRPLPLRERKRLLAKLVPPLGTVRFADHVETEGEALFEQVLQRGLEGVMAKKATSKYAGGRSDDWLKVRADRRGDFWVVGYTEQETPGRVSSLDLLAWREGEPVYAGRVGSGLAEDQHKWLVGLLPKLRRDGPPLPAAAAAPKGTLWLTPRLIAQVRYKEWTEGGQLRHPVLLGLREGDLPPGLDANASKGAKTKSRSKTGSKAAPEPAAGGLELRLSNLDKLYWPEDGYTKGDLVEYYRKVSSWMLPYLRDRPVVLTRYPDGIAGKSFYQKNSPEFLPSWIPTVGVWSEEVGKEIRYAQIQDEEALLFLVNLGTIPFHLWASRAPDLECPDWCILDLDPKGAPFAHVVELARGLRGLCEELGLPAYVKTSGSSGLHVLVPLGAALDYEQSRMLANLLGQLVVDRHPKIATLTRQISARGGKVYVDWLQNRRGQLLVSPWCVRPLPGAPVSTPLQWKEVVPTLDIRRFTLATVPPRLRRNAADPLLPVLTERADVAGALERLARRSG